MPSATRARSSGAPLALLALVAIGCATTPGATPRASDTTTAAGRADSAGRAPDPAAAARPADGVRFEPLPVIGPSAGGRLFFREPLGLSLDHLQRLFVADSGNNRVVVLAPGGSYEAEFGRFGDGDGQFLTPTDVAAREGFFFYVADSENERVQKFDRFRSFVEVVATRGGLGGGFGGPRGIEVDDEGRLYITDTEEDKVWILDAFSGSLDEEIGGFGSAEARFIDPADVAIDSDRRILVADAGNGRIQVFDRLGNFLFASDGSGRGSRPLRRPSGIACDPRGFLFVTDPAEHRVVVLDAAGAYVGELPREGMRAPTGIVYDGEGTLYVSDADANAIFPFRVVHTDAARGE